jgi:hypothetical protein
MKVAILQSNYIPWKGYFDLLHDADVFVFYDEVKYTKNDWRNRNRIYTKDGLQWLSIPIHKDAVKQKISEVALPEGDWRNDHINKLTAAYKKAPYFHQLEALIQDIYFAGHQLLSPFNQYIIQSVCTQLHCPTRIIDSASLQLQGDRVERLIHILQQLDATEYISGPAAKDYLQGNEHLFSDNHITLTYKSYNHYPTYKQLYQPFEHTVSIVDLIANVSWDELNNYIWPTR